MVLSQRSKNQLDKKGLSDIISILLTITLTIVAVVIISGIVIPFVKDSLYSSTECIGFNEYAQFQDLGYNCYNSGKVYLTVKMGTNEKSDSVAGIKLVLLNSAGESTVNEVKTGNSESCGSGGLRMLDNNCTELGQLNFTKSGETITYVYNSTNAGNVFSSAEVYIMLNSGRICERADSVELRACAGGTNYNE
ncbi:MAG: hypothetical protein WCK90_03325 [archaeon]